MLPGHRRPSTVSNSEYAELRPLLSLTATCPELGDPDVARVATFLRDLGPSGNYPIKPLWLEILGGRATYQKYAAKPAAAPLLYNSKQRIAEFAWYLTALACAKGQPLVRGAWCFEDEGYRLFKAFAIHGYSRVLQLLDGRRGVAEKNSFGSTHLLPFVQHSRGRGVWFTPEENILFALAEGTKGGYTQVGIDIEVGRDDGVRLGLLGGSTHILIGKIPLKAIGQKRSFTFFKIEQHGTKGSKDFVMHGFDLLQSLRPKAKSKANAEGVDAETFYMRRERVDKDLLSAFSTLVVAALNCRTASPLWRTHFTTNELESRAKKLGLSFMFDTVTEVRAAAVEMLRDLSAEPVHRVAAQRSAENAAVVQREADAFLKRVTSNPSLDHLRYRFGREVIVLKEEFGARDAALSEAMEAQSLKRSITSKFSNAHFGEREHVERSAGGPALSPTSEQEQENDDDDDDDDDDFDEEIVQYDIGGADDLDLFAPPPSFSSLATTTTEVASTPATTSTARSAIGIFNFSGEFEGELSFIAGDTIEVEVGTTTSPPSCGWGIATSRFGERGVIPLNRIRFDDDA